MLGVQWYYGIYGGVMYVLYVICFFLTVCHAPRRPPITTPTRLPAISFKLMCFQVNLESIKSNLTLNYSSLAHNCSSCVVDCR